MSIVRWTIKVNRKNSSNEICGCSEIEAQTRVLPKKSAKSSHTRSVAANHRRVRRTSDTLWGCDQFSSSASLKSMCWWICLRASPCRPMASGFSDHVTPSAGNTRHRVVFRWQIERKKKQNNYFLRVNFDGSYFIRFFTIFQEFLGCLMIQSVGEMNFRAITDQESTELDPNCHHTTNQRLFSWLNRFRFQKRWNNSITVYLNKLLNLQVK